MIDDLEAYQKLASRLLRLAIEDVDVRADYETEANRTAAERNRASAIHFIRSPMFFSLCRTLRLPADKIQRRAFQ